MKSGSLLWLDFENVNQSGTYYSIGIPGRTYGLVWPDRSIQPELWQLKKSPQPVKIEAVELEKGEFVVFNRFHFTSLKELDASWVLTADDSVLQQGKLNLDIPALEKQTVMLPYQKPQILPGVHYRILIRFKLAGKTKWAEKGHEVAWEQFELPFYLPPEPGNDEIISPLTIEETDAAVVITGKDFTYRISRQSGLIESVNFQGTELIRQPPRFNVWRAPLANELDAWCAFRTDMGYTREGMGRYLANGWLSLGLDRLEHEPKEFRITLMQANMVEMVAEATASSNNYTTAFDVVYTYSVTDRGEIGIRVKSSPEGHMPAWLPKTGIQMKLPDTFQALKWYGRGPFETYPDRKTGAKTGIWESTVDKEYVPYIFPQDHGNRTDVYWVSLADHNGIGLQVTAGELFNFSVQKYDTDNLTRAYYTFQLKDSDAITLNLDHRVSGVGCTAISVLNKYRVLPGILRKIH